MKKIIVFSIITLVIQAVFWSCKYNFVPAGEKEYRSILSDYEGLRYNEAREQVGKNRDVIPTEYYDRLMKQIDWMEDVEHARVTAYLFDDESDRGYVHVPVSADIAGAEGFTETRAVPLLVYQEGFQDFFGVNHDYIHYIQAILAVIGMMLMYDQVEKKHLVKQLFRALYVVGIVYLPELFWILAVYGISGGGCPGVSVGDIGEFPLYGIMRIVFLFRFLGVFTLGNMIMFLNRLHLKRKYLPTLIVAAVQILPAVIGFILVLSGGFSYIICGVSDSLIMTNAIAFRYDYVASLFFVDLIILAVCKFYRIRIYTDKDLARMERHFSNI